MNGLKLLPQNENPYQLVAGIGSDVSVRNIQRDLQALSNMLDDCIDYRIQDECRYYFEVSDSRNAYASPLRIASFIEKHQSDVAGKILLYCGLWE
jgi:hypothetical protein